MEVFFMLGKELEKRVNKGGFFLCDLHTKFKDMLYIRWGLDICYKGTQERGSRIYEWVFTALDNIKIVLTLIPIPEN